MSDQATFDHDHKSSAKSADSKQNTDPKRPLRLTLLLTVLGLLLVAVWYDYTVARPSVDEAFDVVSQLNQKHSSSAEIPVMTRVDVQNAVGHGPSYTISKKHYQIEVYSWTAGLPFRSHDLYAVYRGQGDSMPFLRHYKFVLPMEDLDPKSSGPELAAAQVAARGPGPDPYETVGDQWDADAEEVQQPGSETSEQDTTAGQTAATET